ncbi:MAG: DEAD/DEAH box helicase [Gammaproteobacteria bacterium]|nr:DEAD/DEAH box helicase [Gammaproteobacteria bacterium]
MRDVPFQPVVADWFAAQFAAPTPCQRAAWPAIQAHHDTLIAAPTGSGKTLAAFLASIDELVATATTQGYLDDLTQVVYVSPLKALSNDIERNLRAPLAGIATGLQRAGNTGIDIRAAVRSGDTSPAERNRMRRQPPHILVTTPESLYILLTSESGRCMLSTVRTVIVDEIHAVAGNKRGAHLALSLQRLEALTEFRPVRIGLSATQRPIARIAEFLTGTADRDCQIIDMGHARQRDLAIEIPRSPLAAVMAAEVWSEIYDRLAALVAAHRATLIFVNTRRLAERAARHLAERLGEDAVTSHHGSLAREHRFDAEQRLKDGELRAVVATASLELGIDIGDIDLVCQIGSPRSVSVLLQRVGRSGHALGALPKGRLFPTTRDELVESVALLDAVDRGELDELTIPRGSLDVLAQQIVAEVSCREWSVDELYRQMSAAQPYGDCSRREFDAVLSMLADGFSTRRGRRSAYLHHDAVNHRVRPRRGARLTAITNGGAIPEQFDYDVLLEPEGLRIGSLNEDFAFESLAGDIFQLGNASYRILRVERSVVRVEDAKGLPPTIPFWFGEAPGRSDLLSLAVSRLRADMTNILQNGVEVAVDAVTERYGLDTAGSRQLVEYLGAARAALGVLPTQQTLVAERFFDENGDTHLVVHSPYGSRVNRAWGLALRKRFCRKFNFELQAAALEDSIVLSLGPSHSFPLDEISKYLRSTSVREVLTQALLAAPMFPTHWRWVANIALAVKRNWWGKRVPAPLQRGDAEDLVAVVFPDQLACQENIAGERQIPDHPLVRQTIDDCLTGIMDIDGLERLLSGLEHGDIELISCELTEPSPLAHEILNARPFAFLDDAPAEERRTMAVQARRYVDIEDAAQFAKLDVDAIARVRSEAWPDPQTADELHDALVLAGYLCADEGRCGRRGLMCAEPMHESQFGWQALFDDLCAEQRATCMHTADGQRLWVAAERLCQMQAIFTGASLQPPIAAAGALIEQSWDESAALRELVRSRLEVVGPTRVAVLAASLGVAESKVDAAVLALQHEGFAMQGAFTGAAPGEWCERRLLARIHRYTVQRLRQEIEPVSAADFMRFLIGWHGLTADTQGSGADAVYRVIEQLAGFEIPVAAWESVILPCRIADYSPVLLDELSLQGRVQWLRVPAHRGPVRSHRPAAPVRSTPIVIGPRGYGALIRRLSGVADSSAVAMSSAGRRVVDTLSTEGALFFDELVEYSGMPSFQVEQTLAELVTVGAVSSDHFNGLRALCRSGKRRRRSPRASALGIEHAGRWSSWRQRDLNNSTGQSDADIEQIARLLLRRYGVLFRMLMEREADWMPPWRDLLRVYRRLEARGEIRGGRFVAGFSGEQFALPEAIGALRAVRRHSDDSEIVSVAAADPLNLIGIIMPGERVAANSQQHLQFRAGVFVVAPPATRGSIIDWREQRVGLRRKIRT